MSIKEHPPQHIASTSGDVLHVPVLLEETLRVLDPRAGESYLDLTAGYGGHASAILDRTDNYKATVLVDRDSFAIATLDRFKKKGAELRHTDFVSAAKALVDAGRQFDIVLVDLGVSSPQLDKGERGFSFTHPGPLDMRMDGRQDVSAHTLVNQASESELVRIITTYGEEPLPQARRYASAIVNARPLDTTQQLADLIKQTYKGPWRKTHPATRTFQALRIAVNQELEQVEQLVLLLPKLLASGGRVGVISFHSLEDRLVKQFFKQQFMAGYESELRDLTKKAIDGATSDVHNPRARSAKLRAAVKI